jgi:hypothetical protein
MVWDNNIDLNPLLSETVASFFVPSGADILKIVNISVPKGEKWNYPSCNIKLQ